MFIMKKNCDFDNLFFYFLSSKSVNFEFCFLISCIPVDSLLNFEIKTRGRKREKRWAEERGRRKTTKKIGRKRDTRGEEDRVIEERGRRRKTKEKKKERDKKQERNKKIKKETK